MDPNLSHISGGVIASFVSDVGRLHSAALLVDEAYRVT